MPGRGAAAARVGLGLANEGLVTSGTAARLAAVGRPSGACAAQPCRAAAAPGAGISAKVPAGPGPGKLSRCREPRGWRPGRAHQSLPGRPRLTGHRPGSRASARIRKHFYRVRSCTLWCAGSFAILGCAYRQSPSHHSYQNAVECAFGRLATRCPTGKRLLARHSAFSLSQIPLPYVSHIETVCHRSIT